MFRVIRDLEAPIGGGRLERIYYLLEKDVAAAHDQDRTTHRSGRRARLSRPNLPLRFHCSALGQVGEHLAFCARLASKIAIYRLRWTPLSASTGEFGSIIQQHLEGAENTPAH